MHENHRNNLSESNLFVSTTIPRHREKPTAVKCIESTFSIINAYLWLHVIGFTPRISCKGKSSLITIPSIIFTILVEAHFWFTLYNNVKFSVKNGLYENKLYLANSMIITGNAVLRFLFYTRRKRLKTAAYKLARISAKVCEETKTLKNFRLKMVVMILLNDAVTIIANVDYVLNVNLIKTFDYAEIPPPYLIPSCYISSLLYWLGFPQSAFTAYFCYTCFVLKITLTALESRLLSEIEKEHLIKLYVEITDVIFSLKNLLQPFLLTAILSILFDTFQEFYGSVFMLTDGSSGLFLILLYNFTYLVLICKSSSSVIDAATRVQSAAMKLEISNLKRLQFYLQACQGIPEFKILNSIVVDSSLILSSLGVLLTYGILFATFSNSKKEQGTD